MRKILLVYPKTGWDVKNVSVLLPLAVLYLGRPLRRAGYNPVIIDQRIDAHWDNTLREHLNEGDVFAVGISAMTGAQIKWGLKACRIVRDASPDTPLVWGGIHPSLLPSGTAKHPLVDFLVFGEGESALVDLLDALKHEREPKQIPGVAFQDRHGEFFQGPPRPFLDLDEILIPDYDLVNIPDYITTQTLGERDLAITTSRGCPNRCTFCYNIAYAKRRWRSQSADRVVEHVELITKKFGINAILVKDDNFFVDKERVEAMAESFRKKGIRVTVRAECRADYISSGRYDEAFLGELFDAGFREMTVGAESGTDAGLSHLLKDLTVNDIREANRKLGRAGIASKFTFMTGFPGETWGNVEATLKLMLELVRSNPLARATPLHLYAPFPGTPLFDEAVRQGWRTPDSLSGWADVDFHNAQLPWIKESSRRTLKRISISTYFMDGRTMPEYFSRSPVMRTAARAYGAVIRWRTRHHFFRVMPELWLLDWYRKISAMV